VLLIGEVLGKLKSKYLHSSLTLSLSLSLLPNDPRGQHGRHPTSDPPHRTSPPLQKQQQDTYLDLQASPPRATSPSNLFTKPQSKTSLTRGVSGIMSVSDCIRTPPPLPTSEAASCGDNNRLCPAGDLHSARPRFHLALRLFPVIAGGADISVFADLGSPGK
jgi:hypothetical protein